MRAKSADPEVDANRTWFQIETRSCGSEGAKIEPLSTNAEWLFCCTSCRLFVTTVS
jgi:hypothetical protein